MEIPVIPIALKVLDVDAIKAQGARIAANPLYGEYLASIEEYRRVHNQVPDTTTITHIQDHNTQGYDEASNPGLRDLTPLG